MGEPQELEHVTLNEDQYQTVIDDLIFGYNQLLQWYKMVDNPQVIYTESIADDGKYVRPVIWDREPPTLDIDPAKLFS